MQLKEGEYRNRVDRIRDLRKLHRFVEQGGDQFVPYLRDRLCLPRLQPEKVRRKRGNRSARLLVV